MRWKPSSNNIIITVTMVITEFSLLIRLHGSDETDAVISPIAQRRRLGLREHRLPEGSAWIGAPWKRRPHSYPSCFRDPGLWGTLGSASSVKPQGG